jgi:hypothetical protein
MATTKRSKTHTASGKGKTSRTRKAAAKRSKKVKPAKRKTKAQLEEERWLKRAKLTIKVAKMIYDNYHRDNP